MRRCLFGWAGLLTVALIVGQGYGQNGLGLTPDLGAGASALTVTPQAGAWMICAACYDSHMYGSQARSMAEELAVEIRGHYQLPAYIFNRSGEERQKEHERVEKLKADQRKRLEQEGLPPDTPIHVKTVRIEDQYAVLVGGYKDDVTARKELDRIRKLKPSEKYLQSRVVPDEKGKMHEETVNPFRGAFVCHNPTVQVEKPKQDADLSQRLKEYNAGETYSLLKCPKPVTIVVRVYKAAATIQSQTESKPFMERTGTKYGSVLNANENEAHKMAEFLRNKQLGFEAYVLHTEYNSYVTIGGFDSPDDPRLIQTTQYFLRELNRPRSGVNQLHMQAHFLTDPTPMAVPQVK